MKLHRLFLILVSALLIAAPAMGDNEKDDNKGGLSAVPFAFIGKAGDCAPGSPAGSHIVTAAWLGGMGLPDNGGQNTTAADLATNPNKNDPHKGLLVNKNGPTADCSSSGARILGVKGMTIPATVPPAAPGTALEMGFDYRNGGHCGAGAPRYNVVVKEPAPPVGTGTETFHFVGGCANGTKTPAPQDPAQWTRVRFSNAQAFPPIPPGSKIVSVNLLYDEGTDSTSAPDDPNGVGLAVVDNLDIQGQLIRTGNGIADGTQGQGNNDNNDNGRGNGNGNDDNGDN